MNVIRSEILARAGEFQRAFDDAKPFRHAVIDDFLDADFCERLLADFPRFEDRYALNELGAVGGKAVRMDVRDVSDTYRALDAYLQTPEFLAFVSTITGIPDLLYDPDYIGGGTHENRDGQGLDAHVDFNYHPRTKTHRRLNLIVYLNHRWEEAWGGALQLHADPWNPGANRIESILPLFNRAVIFETNEKSWHGFSRIALPADYKNSSRKSFAIYLYSRERPPQDTAPPHATIYVPDAVPTGIVPGNTLSSADVAELQARFTRLRTQLRYLYDREKQFGAQIAALEDAVAEARSALRLPLQGYATQSAAPSGLWADGWAAREFVAQFTTQRKLHALALDLWVPDRLDGDQTLAIDFGGRSWEHHVAAGTRSQITLDAQCAAGAAATLRIRAARGFVPARDGASSDERQLAWKLLGASLRH